MGRFNDMSNMDILGEIVNLRAEYDAIKVNIAKELDRLDELEKEFKEADDTLAERIKGQRNE